MNLFTINMKLNVIWKDVYFLKGDNQNKLKIKQGKAELVICVVSETVLFHEMSNEGNLDWKILANTFYFDCEPRMFFIHVICLVETTAVTVLTVFRMNTLRFSMFSMFMQSKWL